MRKRNQVVKEHSPNAERTRRTSTATLLEVRGICKSFPGVRALHQVDLTLRQGEVLAVIGENGAGKSTLMKILAGVHAPDHGVIRIDGDPVTFSNVHDALGHGIALIHQELNLADNLDVGANLFLGHEPHRFGFIDRRQVTAASMRALQRIGLDISPSTRVSLLSIGHQQMVEIAKALLFNARVLILDEPTSSLSQHEAEQMFDVVRDLKSRGICVIYISHRLGEVDHIADRVLVLRDGENAGELDRSEISHDRMVRLMVGRDVSQFYHQSPLTPGSAALEVQDLRTRAWPEHPISFTVRTGEIVGIAGLVGAGRTDLLQTLFGVTPPMGGRVRLADQSVAIRSPIDAIAHGMALAPEDRRLHGLILGQNVGDNLSLASLWRDRRFGLTNRTAAQEIGERMLERLNIRTPNLRQIVQYLSGGNQQKVVIGKWLALNPRVLLLDEPTRGIDIGAKEEIYRIMEQLAEQGVAILFASSEMEEILGMSDRVLVMHEGRLTGTLDRSSLSEQRIMQLATGQSANDADRSSEGTST